MSNCKGAHMKKMCSKIVLGAYLAVFGVSASAAPQWCVGMVNQLWIASDGTVYVYPSYRNDFTRICNINAETGGVSVTTCLAWFAMLRNAVQRQSTVTVYYVEAPACNALPSYANTPIPYYVMQVN